MFLLEKTSEFDKWLRKLDDRKAKAKILLRLQRIESGNLGDVSSVGDGIEEIRIHFGPGYRIYFKKQGDKLILLLIGGDKSTQDSDIKKAKSIWNHYKYN
ncbi:type II toxin-antitoxin system RelE/ParE family toxin [Algoriphagus sp.]|uniref:type II toxin-antitoxin system RelE/ParE family toxin n=1 Tax=Algoriphagus sp. TaxID=1872435 RepID=UPI0039190082